MNTVHRSVDSSSLVLFRIPPVSGREHFRLHFIKRVESSQLRHSIYFSFTKFLQKLRQLPDWASSALLADNGSSYHVRLSPPVRGKRVM